MKTTINKIINIIEEHINKTLSELKIKNIIWNMIFQINHFIFIIKLKKMIYYIYYI